MFLTFTKQSYDLAPKYFFVFLLCASLALACQSDSESNDTSNTDTPNMDDTPPMMSGPGDCSGSYMYRLTVSFEWNGEGNTHSNAPRGAHFSPVFVATHRAGVDFWKLGALASKGIESMAETGGTSTLRQEFMSSEQADCIFSGTGARGPKSNQVVHSQNIEFPFDPDFPFVTVVSMIAPSPDWFVGISSYNLLDGSKMPQASYTHPMRAYDAGTDDGPDFTSSNMESNPHMPISRLNDASLDFTMDDDPLGNFVFELIEVEDP